MLIKFQCTPENANYSRVLKGFNVEWEALENISKEDGPDFPTLSRTQTVNLRIASTVILGLVIVPYYKLSYIKYK